MDLHQSNIVRPSGYVSSDQRFAKALQDGDLNSEGLVMQLVHPVTRRFDVYGAEQLQQ